MESGFLHLDFQRVTLMEKPVSILVLMESGFLQIKQGCDDTDVKLFLSLF